MTFIGESLQKLISLHLLYKEVCFLINFSHIFLTLSLASKVSRCLNHLSWLFLMRRSNRSTLIAFRRTKLFTPFLQKSPEEAHFCCLHSFGPCPELVAIDEHMNVKYCAESVCLKKSLTNRKKSSNHIGPTTCT